MKRIPFAVLLLCIFYSHFVAAQSSEFGDEVMASRGEGVLTHRMFDARVARIPEQHRLRVIRDRGRLEDLLGNLLLKLQLADAARKAGLDKDPLVMDRVALAAVEELGNAWLEHYVSSVPEGNFEALAQENYLLNKDKYHTEKTVDVSHILIRATNRSEQEALELATTVAKKARANPGSFVELVAEYSEDPSAGSNKGSFRAVKKGDMVQPFEKAAFSQAVGEISNPVETQYGYHIIRVDQVNEPKQKSFDDVKNDLISQERSRHEERVRLQYLNELAREDVELTQEALEKMVERYFGRDAMANANEVPDSE